MPIKVISLENRKGSTLGQTQVVSRGYARYLVRTEKALPYSDDNKTRFKNMKAELEKSQAEKLAQAHALEERLKTLTIQLSSRAANETRLYGSLGAKEISEALIAAGIPVERQQVYLDKGPLRTLGMHKVFLNLHEKVKVELLVEVKAA